MIIGFIFSYILGFFKFLGEYCLKDIIKWIISGISSGNWYIFNNYCKFILDVNSFIFYVIREKYME